MKFIELTSVEDLRHVYVNADHITMIEEPRTDTHGITVCFDVLYDNPDIYETKMQAIAVYESPEEIIKRIKESEEI